MIQTKIETKFENIDYYPGGLSEWGITSKASLVFTYNNMYHELWMLTRYISEILPYMKQYPHDTIWKHALCHENL